MCVCAFVCVSLVDDLNGSVDAGRMTVKAVYVSDSVAGVFGPAVQSVGSHPKLSNKRSPME